MKKCKQKSEKCIKMLKKAFSLPPIPTLLVSIPSYALVIYTLTEAEVNPAIAYASYFLSAYALIITVTRTVGAVRLFRQGMDRHPLVRKAMDIPLVDRYLKEDKFRAEAALYQGFLINLLYAGIKVASGILYSSVWFMTLGAYYILLALMRASLLHTMRKNAGCATAVYASAALLQWRRYRLCGIILLLMNFVLSGIVVLVVHQNSGFTYPGILIYVMAMYAFYATITAVRNVIKFRRYGSPVLSAAKAINLTAALVSMLSLETAMLTRFGAAEDPVFRQSMTAATGAGISAIVLGMAVFMILRSAKTLRQIKQKKEHVPRIKALSRSDRKREHVPQNQSPEANQKPGHDTRKTFQRRHDTW